ncbi:MAG: protein translocase subunit SecD [Pyramidobacter sp.]|nr:protein translocase subunit SecD [Pyramidobacter sp.]
MLRKDRWRLIFMAVVIIVSAFIVFPIKGRINLGLDLRGGAHIVLQAKGTQDAPLTPDSLDRLLVVLRNRVDQYGVAEPLLQKQGDDRVIVDLPGVEDPQAALRLIGRTALLEFREVLQSSQPLPPQAQRKNYDSDEEFNAAVERWNAYKAQQEEQKKKLTESVKDKDGQIVASDEDGTIYLLGKVYLTGKELSNARQEYDQLGRPDIALEFSSEGADLFEKATEATVGRQLAIVLDGAVISAPRVNERISGGKAVITGRFSVEEARSVAIMLRAGALPVNVEILENRSVGPSLGADSIDAGIFAGAVGLAAVFLFMICYYRLWGLTADISLLTTLLVLFAQLILMKATLTMPGIAGIILTIGMAVDSNILIFERIKEELRAGKTPNAALTSGFSNALTTILDSNITTVIAAAALGYFGSGPLRGFAWTLTMGIVASLFSALAVNRVLLQFLVSRSSKTFQVRAR